MKRLTVVLLTLLLAMNADAAYAGRPLRDALRELQQRGLRLVYSDELVRADMLVRAEPSSSEPRQILDELLREQGLCAKKGPRGTLLVVRCKASAPRITPPPPPPQSAVPSMPVTLAEITVTPSAYTLLGDTPNARQFLGREEVRRVPHVADDLYRAIGRVPGVAASDISARFNLRGGAEDETLVLIDGAEIYDPFHVKDLSRAFSTLDAEAVGSVNILSGGYPVEFGGRMSGVVDVTTLAPDDTRHELGIGLLHTHALSRGSFGNARGAWLLSVRRGYLREVLQLIDDTSEINPRYFDMLGKVQWTLGSRAVVSVHGFAAHDKLRLDEELGSNARATYDDRYAWLNLQTAVTPHLFVQSVASYASLSRDRGGSFENRSGSQTGALEDRRDATLFAWKNDASYDLTARNLLKAGVTLRQVRASYDIEGQSRINGTTFYLGAPPRQVQRSVHVDPSGTDVDVYVADRFRISPRLVAEAGVRASAQSYTPDGVALDPRLQLAWAPAERTAVRAAWGIFHQPQRIDELEVEDGITEFDDAQRSEHRVLSIEQGLPRNAQVRLELYDKALTHLRPRYENLYDRLLLFPELRDDRVRIAPERGHARGAELLLRSNPAAPVSAWVSYTLASVTDHLDGRDVPRAWDQRHAVTFSTNYRRGTAWNFNVAGTWHSGWPTTPVVARLAGRRVVSMPGLANSERLDAYRRVDLRVMRTFRRVDLFLELFNVLNAANVSRIDSFDFNVAADGVVTPIARTEAVLGVVPSFGVTWRF